VTAPSDPAAFRGHVREVLAAIATRREELGAVPAYVPRQIGATFQRQLAAEGLVGLEVPRRYGGAGLDRRHAEIFNEEAADYWLPSVLFAVTIGMCVPVLLEFGTEEQKLAHIPAMLRGEEIWCQMFSEPGAGSDLASLQMRAVLDGDHWVLDGQKVWTSAAHYADVAMCAARTDPEVPRHGGVSMFMVPLHTTGVDVRPLRLMTGLSAFNEVFCTDVRIPADHLIGEVNDGWRCVSAMLMNERVALGASSSPLVTGLAQEATARAMTIGRTDEPLVRERLARLTVSERVLGLVAQSVRAQQASGPRPGPEGSIAKLMGSELVRTAAAVNSRIAGAAAQAWDADDAEAAEMVRSVLHAPSLSIAGGTSEIQRNIIAERVLGLPREPVIG
jgi:alkylation response protein AidB-like acyl-CoA dehydrogenase